MSVATYAEFGLEDRDLYARYLEAVCRSSDVKCLRDHVFLGRRSVPVVYTRVLESGECGVEDGVIGGVDGYGHVGTEHAVGESVRGLESDGGGAGDGCIPASCGFDCGCGSGGVNGGGTDCCAGRSAAGVVSSSVASGVSVVDACEKRRRRNRRKRQSKLAKKREAMAASSWRRSGEDSGVDSGVSVGSAGSSRSELRATLEAKWMAENALREAEARRKLELLRAQDLGQLVKLQERKIHSATERAIVAAEKAHATLRATGNVPGVVPEGGYEVGVAPVDGTGFCETVVECTISPDSSASMKEFRACQKELEDVKAEFAAFKLQVKKEKFDRYEAVTMTCDSEGDMSEARQEWVRENIRETGAYGPEEEWLYSEERGADGFRKRAGVRVQKVRGARDDCGDTW